MARTEERRDALTGLMGKPDVKRPPVRLRSRWEDNTKFGVQEIRSGGRRID